MAVSIAMLCQFQIQGSRGSHSAPSQKTIFSHRDNCNLKAFCIFFWTPKRTTNANIHKI